MKTSTMRPHLYISLWVIESIKISPLASLVEAVVCIASDHFYGIKDISTKSRMEGQNSKLANTSFDYERIQAERFRISWSFSKVLVLS